MRFLSNSASLLVSSGILEERDFILSTSGSEFLLLLDLVQFIDLLTDKPHPALFCPPNTFQTISPQVFTDNGYRLRKLYCVISDDRSSLHRNYL